VPLVELRIYRFGSDTRFEGLLVGALERVDVLESGRVLDALFVGSDGVTGEIAVFDACGADLRKMLVELLDFRLDAAARDRATAQALAADSDGVPAETIQELADALEPGAGLVAVLMEQGPADTIDEAVSRAGGAPVVTSRVDATRLADCAADLQAAAAIG
jgi:hypothetical protein